MYNALDALVKFERDVQNKETPDNDAVLSLP